MSFFGRVSVRANGRPIVFEPTDSQPASPQTALQSLRLGALAERTMQLFSGKLQNRRFLIAASTVLLVSILLAAVPLGAAVLLQAVGQADNLTIAIDDFVTPYVSAKNFSGVVLVARDGDRLVERGYGRADYELDVPVGPQTRFRIASVTKSFTAAAVLLLADRGAIELDQPIGRYLVEFPHGDQISVRHLLAHQSGLPNYYYDLEDYPTLSRQPYERPADVVALVAGMELRFEPGTRYAYNNMNYTALAWLMEELSGLAYEEFLRRELLSPLGLPSTGYSRDVTDLIPDLARGYDPVGVEGLRKSPYFDFSISIGASATYSTAGDLARWAERLMGGDLLVGESLEGALEYGWREQEIYGRRALVASGWDNVGYSAHVIHVPDEKLTVVVLCNLNIAQVVGEIAMGLSAIALSEEARGVPLAPRPLPADSLRPLAGRYRFGDDFYSPGGLLDLEVRDGWLIDVGREPEAALIPLGDGGFLYRPVWAVVRFIAGEQGTITGLTFYDRFTASKESD